MRDVDKERKLQVTMAVEELKRIGFEGDPYEEVKKDGWFARNRWQSKEQEEEFRAWAIEQIRKLPHFEAKEAAEGAFAWFDLSYGLRSADAEEER